jgi:hypothetical protein
MLFREIIVVYFENDMTHANSLLLERRIFRPFKHVSHIVTTAREIVGYSRSKISKQFRESYSTFAQVSHSIYVIMQNDELTYTRIIFLSNIYLFCQKKICIILRHAKFQHHIQ